MNISMHVHGVAHAEPIQQPGEGSAYVWRLRYDIYPTHIDFTWGTTDRKGSGATKDCKDYSLVLAMQHHEWQELKAKLPEELREPASEVLDRANNAEDGLYALYGYVPPSQIEDYESAARVVHELYQRLNPDKIIDVRQWFEGKKGWYVVDRETYRRIF